ncbi:hypothetical protein I312_100331 [Cryptococcus bacillisporus CA1280]|uniref:TM7S3/TM198-like domain-containing protein n=2 Tax=Cryptococcus gattii TaxID=552467 RepID=A0A0D0VTL7_CRYGA|nr:hypothetical protein I312_00921 [Cryptococcus bacillisporus CA1280]KIR68578.1 hypothetical protein I314_00999 [Cryptococcus bacillisporus CA1873]|eukprot:KIR68578.1 hypothetical protein I314_00999 [Cryptococcus gattii CA1873]
MRISIVLTAAALFGSTLISAHTPTSTPLPNLPVVIRADTNESTPGNDTQTWSQGDDWIPFNIVIDPAYGIAGAVLILSGIPVAVLGSKNRWSSLAVASGLAFFLFTLVMILRFGVEPNLAPPSPHPPSATLRGLYLLACLISSFIGAGLGIFFFNFTKYAISAAGGFTFGWFLLALRQGGLITSVVGRWALLGALTVVVFIASLPKRFNDLMILVSTAWIGATAFVLGVDCYTRAGLKEFYVYNLGFHDLFPKLDGAKYPLTQMMIIELGILGAVVLIGAAIQFRVVGMLQKRLNQLRDEEEARIEEEEISKAAERFKNVGAELVEWEKKHGGNPVSESGLDGTEKSGSAGEASFPSEPYAISFKGNRSSVLLPQLEFKASQEPEILNKRASSSLSLLGHDTSPQMRRSSSLSLPRIASDLGEGFENLNSYTPTNSMFLGIEELKPEEPFIGVGRDSSDLESKLKLLEEIKKARESVQGSLELLRSRTPSGTQSVAGPSSAVIPAELEEMQRRHSSVSTKLLDEAKAQSVSGTSNRPPFQTHMTEAPPQHSEWDMYVAERKIISPLASPSPNSAFLSVDPQCTTIPVSVAKGIGSRRERTMSMLETKVSDFGPAQQEQKHGTFPGRSSVAYVPDMERRESVTHHDYLESGIPSRPLAANRPRMSYSGPTRIVSASNLHPASAAPYRSSAAKIMSIEELAERHRQRLSKMQQPVTSKLKESEQIEEARKEWEKQRAREKDEMRRRETERGRENEDSQGKTREVVRRTDQWRRSIVVDPELQVGGERKRSEEKAKTQGRTLVN